MTFTKVALDKLLKTRPQRQYSIWDSKEPHLSVLVSRGPEHKKRGTVTFRCIYYLPTAPGKPRYLAIGRWPDGAYTYPYKNEKGKVITISCSDIDAVRLAASDIFNRAKSQGIDPRRPPASGGFADVVKVFLEEHASKKRSYREIERIFARYVLPEWGLREITDIERNDVAVLLSKIKNKKVKYRVGRSAHRPSPVRRWPGSRDCSTGTPPAPTSSSTRSSRGCWTRTTSPSHATGSCPMPSCVSCGRT